MHGKPSLPGWAQAEARREGQAEAHCAAQAQAEDSGGFRGGRWDGDDDGVGDGGGDDAGGGAPEAGAGEQPELEQRNRKAALPRSLRLGKESHNTILFLHLNENRDC